MLLAVAAAVVAAVVLTAVVVVSTMAAEDQGQPLVVSLEGSGRDDGSLYVNTLNFLATFGYYLAYCLASVYLLVSQKETNKKCSFCSVYPCIASKGSY